MPLTAYNTKTKEKNVPIYNATALKLKNGTYLIKGDDGQGNKLSTICGKGKAEEAIESGEAKDITPTA